MMYGGAPCCGSPGLVSSPLRPHQRWEHGGPGDGPPRSTKCTEMSCRWNRSTRGEEGGWNSSLTPAPSGTPPKSGSWRIPSRCASEDAWSTERLHTSGRSSPLAVGCLCSGRRKPEVSPNRFQSHPQSLRIPASVMRWQGNHQRCWKVWSSSAKYPHPDIRRDTPGIEEAFFCQRLRI